jgi:hypothetical protein
VGYRGEARTLLPCHDMSTHRTVRLIVADRDASWFPYLASPVDGEAVVVARLPKEAPSTFASRVRERTTALVRDAIVEVTYVMGSPDDRCHDTVLSALRHSHGIRPAVEHAPAGVAPGPERGRGALANSPQL